MRVARATAAAAGPRAHGDVYFCEANWTAPNGDRTVYGAKCVATGSDDSGRLDVQFEGNKGPIRCRLIELSLTPPPAELLGGYRVGEPVYYTGKDGMANNGDRVVNGWRGVVAGPHMSLPDTHLMVKFEQNKGNVAEPRPSLSRLSPKVRLRRGRRAAASLRLAPRARPPRPGASRPPERPHGGLHLL